MYRCCGVNASGLRHRVMSSLTKGAILPAYHVPYRPLMTTVRKPGKFKMAMLRWKQIAKQYGVLWFAWYWGTFLPLFAVFTIPYHCGFDLVGLGDYLERHGWLEWLKWFNINIRNLIDRCNEKDTFVIFDSFMDGNYKIEFNGETASMIFSTFIVWELCKPLRYGFYLYMCRATVAFCRKRNIMPKFFSKF